MDALSDGGASGASRPITPRGFGVTTPANFDDALLHLKALERKVRGEVQHDLRDLKLRMTSKKIEDVGRKATRLYEIRKHLVQSKSLYAEEAEVMLQFEKIKGFLKQQRLDEESWDKTKNDCRLLGDRLSDIRQRQRRLSGRVEELETVIGEIMSVSLSDDDFSDIDMSQFRRHETATVAPSLPSYGLFNSAPYGVDVSASEDELSMSSQALSLSSQASKGPSIRVTSPPSRNAAVRSDTRISDIAALAAAEPEADTSLAAGDSPLPVSNLISDERYMSQSPEPKGPAYSRPRDTTDASNDELEDKQYFPRKKKKKPNGTTRRTRQPSYSSDTDADEYIPFDSGTLKASKEWAEVHVDDEERIKREEEEIKKLEEEARVRAEENEKKMAAAREKTDELKKKTEELMQKRAKQEEERRQREEEEEREAEAEARKQKEEAEKMLAEKAAKKKELAAKKKAAAEAKKLKEEEQIKEKEAKKKAALEAKKKKEEEEKKKAEEEARQKEEEEAKKKARIEAKKKAIEEAKKKAEEEAKRKAEEEERKKAEAEEKHRAKEEAWRKAEEARRAEADAKKKAEEDAKIKAIKEEEEKRAAEEAKALSVLEEKRRLKEEEKIRAEEEIAKKKAEEDARLIQEEESRAQAREEQKRLEAEEEAQRKAEETEKRAAEAKAMLDDLKKKSDAGAKKIADEEARKAAEEAKQRAAEAKERAEEEQAKKDRRKSRMTAEREAELRAEEELKVKEDADPKTKKRREAEKKKKDMSEAEKADAEQTVVKSRETAKDVNAKEAEEQNGVRNRIEDVPAFKDTELTEEEAQKKKVKGVLSKNHSADSTEKNQNGASDGGNETHSKKKSVTVKDSEDSIDNGENIEKLNQDAEEDRLQKKGVKSRELSEDHKSKDEQSSDKMSMGTDDKTVQKKALKSRETSKDRKTSEEKMSEKKPSNKEASTKDVKDIEASSNHEIKDEKATRTNADEKVQKKGLKSREPSKDRTSKDGQTVETKDSDKDSHKKGVKSREASNDRKAGKSDKDKLGKKEKEKQEFSKVFKSTEDLQDQTTYERALQSEADNEADSKKGGMKSRESSKDRKADDKQKMVLQRDKSKEKVASENEIKLKNEKSTEKQAPKSSKDRSISKDRNENDKKADKDISNVSEERKDDKAEGKEMKAPVRGVRNASKDRKKETGAKTADTENTSKVDLRDSSKERQETKGSKARSVSNDRTEKDKKAAKDAKNVSEEKKDDTAKGKETKSPVKAVRNASKDRKTDTGAKTADTDDTQNVASETNPRDSSKERHGANSSKDRSVSKDRNEKDVKATKNVEDVSQERKNDTANGKESKGKEEKEEEAKSPVKAVRNASKDRKKESGAKTTDTEDTPNVTSETEIELGESKTSQGRSVSKDRNEKDKKAAKGVRNVSEERKGKETKAPVKVGRNASKDRKEGGGDKAADSKSVAESKDLEVFGSDQTQQGEEPVQPKPRGRKGKKETPESLNGQEQTIISGVSREASKERKSATVKDIQEVRIEETSLRQDVSDLEKELQVHEEVEKQVVDAPIKSLRKKKGVKEPQKLTDLQTEEVDAQGTKKVIEKQDVTVEQADVSFNESMQRSKAEEGTEVENISGKSAVRPEEIKQDMSEVFAAISDTTLASGKKARSRSRDGRPSAIKGDIIDQDMSTKNVEQVNLEQHQQAHISPEGIMTDAPREEFSADYANVSEAPPKPAQRVRRGEMPELEDVSMPEPRQMTEEEYQGQHDEFWVLMGGTSQDGEPVQEEPQQAELVDYEGQMRAQFGGHDFFEYRTDEVEGYEYPVEGESMDVYPRTVGDEELDFQETQQVWPESAPPGEEEHMAVPRRRTRSKERPKAMAAQEEDVPYGKSKVPVDENLQYTDLGYETLEPRSSGALFREEMEKDIQAETQFESDQPPSGYGTMDSVQAQEGSSADPVYAQVVPKKARRKVSSERQPVDSSAQLDVPAQIEVQSDTARQASPQRGQTAQTIQVNRSPRGGRARQMNRSPQPEHREDMMVQEEIMVLQESVPLQDSVVKKSQRQGGIAQAHNVIQQTEHPEDILVQEDEVVLQESAAALHEPVVKKTQKQSRTAGATRYTDDGHVINEDLSPVERKKQAKLKRDKSSERSSTTSTMQRKKVSFAATNEQFNMKPEPEVKTIPGTSLYTFSPSKTREQPAVEKEHVVVRRDKKKLQMFVAQSTDDEVEVNDSYAEIGDVEHNAELEEYQREKIQSLLQKSLDYQKRQQEEEHRKLQEKLQHNLVEQQQKKEQEEKLLEQKELFRQQMWSPQPQQQQQSQQQQQQQRLSRQQDKRLEFNVPQESFDTLVEFQNSVSNANAFNGSALPNPNPQQQQPATAVPKKTSSAPTSPKAFLKAMTSRQETSRGRNRSEEPQQSIFGSLLRRGRSSSAKPGSRSSSRQSSTDRSEKNRSIFKHMFPPRSESSRPSSPDPGKQRQLLRPGGSSKAESSFGSTENLNQVQQTKSSLEQDISDIESEMSFIDRLSGRKKKKPKKVQAYDFEELFARGHARSAQADEEVQAAQKSTDIFAAEMAVETRRLEGERKPTPFEVYSKDEAFKISQQGAGIGYEEKVKSYLDDQQQYGVHSPPRQGRDRVKKSDKSKRDISSELGSAGESRSRSRSNRRPQEQKMVGQYPPEQKKIDLYTKPEEVKIEGGPAKLAVSGTVPPVNGTPSTDDVAVAMAKSFRFVDKLLTAATPDSPQTQFVRRAEEFVKHNEEDPQLSQPVWPALVSSPNDLPPTKDQMIRSRDHSPHVRTNSSPFRLTSDKHQEKMNSAPYLSLPNSQPFQDPDEINNQNLINNLRLGIHPKPQIGLTHHAMDQADAPMAPRRDPNAKTRRRLSHSVPAKAKVPLNQAADRHLPTHLTPDRLSADEEKYRKMESELQSRGSRPPSRAGSDSHYNYAARDRSGSRPGSRASDYMPTIKDTPLYQTLEKGLRNIEGILDDSTTFRDEINANVERNKYSHHRGRAEFGTLRPRSRRTSETTASSRDPSGDRNQRASRHGSRESDFSFVSDGQYPDLMDMHQPMISSNRMEQMARALAPHQDVLNMKMNVLDDISKHRKAVKETKVWIQVLLTLILCVCVAVYLQSEDSLS